MLVGLSLLCSGAVRTALSPLWNALSREPGRLPNSGSVDHKWSDKPQWGSDARTVSFLSKGQTSHLNLWAAQFDPERGKPIGEPFALTHFDSSKREISPYMDDSYSGMSPRHAVLQMMSVSGSVWMLENVEH